MILVLALVSATLQPAAPRVGDLITVTFSASVTLDASNEFEIVTRSERAVVVRTFTPSPFALSGVLHEPQRSVRFRNLRIPVRSVLKEGDDRTPAPLSPPREQPYPLAPFVAIAAAALLAVAAWTAVWWRSRLRVAVAAAPALSPADRYRRALLALRDSPPKRRWATLADETRLFLAATRPHLGAELTTSELLPRLDTQDAVVAEVLRQGDLEKFSPEGATGRDFEDVLRDAFALTGNEAWQETAGEPA